MNTILADLIFTTFTCLLLVVMIACCVWLVMEVATKVVKGYNELKRQMKD